jgi:hypothetical protein
VSDAPGAIEYVLQPIEGDKGEMAVTEGERSLVVDVCVKDLDDNLTIIGVDPETPVDQVLMLQRMIQQSPQASAGRHFIVVHGDISKWVFARLIRRDKWDKDFNEPA